MGDFTQIIGDQQDLTREQQKKAGTPLSGAMDDKIKQFLETLIQLIDSEEIDPYVPESFLNQEIYSGLSEEWKEKSDLALINIASQIQQIDQFYRSNQTPDSSPQLQSMVEALWEMKQRIEEHHDVFKF